HATIILTLKDNVPILGLVVLLIVRMTLTLFANTNKLTGGVFVPILALGAILASIFANVMERAFGLSNVYHTAILVLGISACISSMMKMPLTAIVFSLEVLGCSNNVLYVVIVVAVSYVITESLGAKGINDSIVNDLIKSQEETHERKIIDTHIVIKKGSFAEYMHARDIIWPANFFLLSIIPSETRHAHVDQQGSKTFHEGDVLHIRYATFDEAQTKRDLIAIVGEQDYDETEAGPE
ncbi:MAG: chloride channel protein, partial [Clostridia bacterium]|nr:chloride channel protein [Clostridia bacterium]